MQSMFRQIFLHLLMVCLFSIFTTDRYTAQVPVVDSFKEVWDLYNRGDYATALRLCRPLAERGQAKAQALLGVMYQLGQGSQPNFTEAIKWFRLAAEQGDVVAQFRLGAMYDQGQGVSQNDFEAMKWYKSAAEQGHLDAQMVIAGKYIGGRGVSLNKAEAARWYRRAALQGEATAQLILGMMYRDGDGVSKDYAEAFQWFRRSSELGNAISSFHVGLMYARGEGVIKNIVEAVKWWRLAAEKGEVEAQYRLGLTYEFGLEVTKSITEAARFYRMAAEQGNPKAQFSVGTMFYEGNGVPQSYAEAIKWFRLAAAQGNGRAQSSLGNMYANGEGVPQDYVKAHMWFNLGGINSSDNFGKQARDSIAAQMTNDQIALAQKMAQRCQDSKFKDCGEPSGDRAGSIHPQTLTTNDIEEFLSHKAPASKKTTTNAPSSAIPLVKQGGTFAVPVMINNKIPLNFTVDSGAADVSIPEDVVTTLMRTGTLTQDDFIGEQTYRLADGSTRTAITFRIRSMKVGDRVVENVLGSIAPSEGSLLLGQSFLKRFKSWSIDNRRQVLILE